MFFSTRFVELNTAVICYRSEFEMDKISSDELKTMEVGLSALSRGAEWGKNKFWLDTTHFGWATLIVAR